MSTRSCRGRRQSWGSRVAQVLIGLVVATGGALTAGAVAPQPVHAQGSDMLWWNDAGDSFTTFGANAAITINTGTISYVADCSPYSTHGTNDFVNPAADIYIVPSGSATVGSKLWNAATPDGSPDVVINSPFLDETIGYTFPGGHVGPGKWAVVFNECQDGQVDPIDTVFDPAFVVSDVDPHIPPAPSIVQLKADAQKQADSWQTEYRMLDGLFKALDYLDKLSWFSIVPGLSTDFGDQMVSMLETFFQRITGVDPQAGAVSLVLNEYRHYKALAADPPDPAFQQGEPLRARTNLDPQSSDPVTVPAVAMADQVATEDSLLQSLIDAFQRYQGAQAAGDANWALFHARATRDYANQLSAQLDRSDAALTALGKAINSDPRQLDDEITAWNGFRSQVITSGLTPDQVALVHGYGMTDSQIANLVTQIQAQDWTGMSRAAMVAQLSAIQSQNAALKADLGQLATQMDGIASSLSTDPYVVTKWPVAAPGGPYSGSTAAPVAFDGSSSTAPAGSSASYAWDLTGSGTFADASGANPSYSFAQETHGLAGLEVTDSAGNAAYAYAPLDVTSSNHRPTISAFTPSPLRAKLLTGQTQAFGVTVSDADGDVPAVTWNVDGTAAGTGSSYTYSPGTTDAGIHQLEVVVDDGKPDGAVSLTWSVDVAEHVVNALFDPSGDHDVSMYELGAHTVASSSNYGGHYPDNMLKWGNTDPGQYPWATAYGQLTNQYAIFTLNGGGTYLIDRVQVMPRPYYGTQRVKDFAVDVSTTTADPAAFTTVLTATAANDGNLQEFKLATPALAKYIRYRPLDNEGDSCCISTQVFRAISGQQGGSDTVNFQNLTTATAGDTVAYSWDFGDGSAASTDASPSHTFPGPGTYTVTLTATNGLGQTSSYSLQQTIFAPTSATLSLYPTAPSEGQYTTFTDTTKLPAGVVEVSRSWAFDGAAFYYSSASVSQAFATGTHSVSLTVKDSDGVTSTMTQTFTAGNVGPHPYLGVSLNFNVPDVPGGPRHEFDLAGYPVYLSANPVDPGQNFGEHMTCAWDFGDGSPGSASCGSVSHTFPAMAPGDPATTYTVTFTATDASGVIGTASVNVPIRAAVVERMATAPGGIIGIAWSPLVKKLVVNQNYSCDNRIGLVSLDGSYSGPISPAFTKRCEEAYIAVSPGKAGFNLGDVFTGNGNPGEIVRIQMDSSGHVTHVDNPWATVTSGGVLRGGLAFDEVGSFNGDLLTTWSDGKVYRTKADGTSALVADMRPFEPGLPYTQLEGADVATSGFGPAGGCLLAGDEYGNHLWAVCPDGSHKLVYTFDSAVERAHFVPSPGDLFFVDYPEGGVIKGDSRVFGNSLIGHAVVVTEYDGHIWDLYWDAASSSYKSRLIGVANNSYGNGMQLEGTAFLPALSSINSSLAPATGSAPTGSTHTVTATVADSFDNPVSGLTLTFTVTGANSASGTAVTDSTGVANFTYTGSVAGTDSIVASSLSATTNAVSMTWIASTKPTKLTYSGPASADYHDDATLSASLVDASTGGGPLPGQSVTFTLGTQTCSATTGADGSVSCAITSIASKPGSTTVHATFAGTKDYQPSSADAPFTVALEQAVAAYTGPAAGVNGQPVTLSAQLAEDGTLPLASRVLTFSLGTGAAAQTCSGTTDASGAASCTITAISQPPGPADLSVAFAGDAYYAAASASAKVEVRHPTVIVYTGSTTQDHHDDAALGASVTDPSAGGAAIPGLNLTFTLGAQSCSAVSDSTGSAACTIPALQLDAGPAAVQATFAAAGDYLGSEVSAAFTVTREETAVAYAGPATASNGKPLTLVGKLTEDAAVPLQGETLTLTLGTGGSAQSCQGSTDATGTASCTLTAVAQPAGDASLSVAFAGDTDYLAATALATVHVYHPTSISYTGATSADYHDAVGLSAVLVDSSVTPAAGLPGLPVVFSVGSAGCSASTGPDGTASCGFTPQVPAGSYALASSFAGNDLYLSSSAGGTFNVLLEETKLTYTGKTVLPVGSPATLSANLTEDGTAPIAGRTVTLTVGTGSAAQSCTGVTDASGNVSCSPAGALSQPLGPGTITASFAGDAYYKAATDSRSSIIFAFSSPGLFVVGDGSATGNVEFWGSSWAKVNSLSGGAPPSDFKGYVSGALAPTACGSGVTWTAAPGNSGNPPADLPSYMGVVVSSHAGRSGSTLSGDVVEIAVVQTASSYKPDPGHDGTGTVAAVYCGPAGG